jgi:hypothetical protein
MAVDDANTDARRDTTERISPDAAPGASPGTGGPCTVATYCREYRAPGEFPARASIAA